MSFNLVLGFKEDDINIRAVNPLTKRESGLCLLTINESPTCYRLKSKKFPQTHRIQAEFGKKTDTNFLDGKTLEKTTYGHLQDRPQRFYSLLDSIQSSHQKEAFKYLKVMNYIFSCLIGITVIIRVIHSLFVTYKF